MFFCWKSSKHKNEFDKNGFLCGNVDWTENEMLAVASPKSLNVKRLKIVSIFIGASDR